MKYRIGIDIGGTNTDAVLVDSQEKIVTSIKVPTTEPLDKGFHQALKGLLNNSIISLDTILGVFVGTTHATNAILECRDLNRVGVIRIAGHRPDALPPGYGWPSMLRKKLISGVVTVEGGFECDGRPITKLNTDEIKNAAINLENSGAESLAICGVFSNINPDQEILAATIITEALNGAIPLSLSHRIGGLGFLERENATILNAGLKKVMQNGFRELVKVCKTLGLKCPLHLIQNNGSLLSLEEAMEYPILTISAGPTNSFVGGTKLAGLKDALVVDIGGTSTDVGIVSNGFPRRCMHNSTIGGVSLNFTMPDVLSVALGGGSHISLGNDSISIGPQSVAKNLLKDSKSFGGAQLTLTDVSLSLGHIQITGSHTGNLIEKNRGHQVIRLACERINTLVTQMEAEKSHLPIILVGGGAALIPLEYLGNRFLLPKHSSVANAYGAALAEVSVTLNEVICLDEREHKLPLLQEKVLSELVKKGGIANKGRIIDVTLLPYFYMPGNLARVTVVGAAPQAR